MTEAAAAAEPVAAEPVASSSPASIIEILEEAGAEAASASGEAAPAAPVKAGEFDASIFSEAALSTPEGVRAAREAIQAQVKEAEALRRKAHNARAEAERRERRFKGQREQVFQERQATQAQMQLLQRELADLQSGDPEKFIEVVGRLANAKDPYEFWNKTAVALAKGKPVGSDTAQDSELRREVEQLKAERYQERVQNEERAIYNLRVEQLQHAATFTDLAHVSALAADPEHVPLVDARLMAIKQDYFRANGRALDTRSACGILEKEIQSHLELLQRVGNPNGLPVAAAAPAGQVRQPEPRANPVQPKGNRQVTALPASLAAEPSTAHRARTKAEKEAAKIAGLDALGIFANFGMR